MEERKIVLPKELQKQMLKFFLSIPSAKKIHKSLLSKNDRGEKDERN